MIAERLDARPWIDEQLEPLFADAFPEFITADHVAKLYIDRVREFFGAFNIMLLGDGDTPIATGWAVPICWNGSPDDLPDGYTDTTRRAVECHESTTPVDTLVICGGIVRRDMTGRGLAGQLINALCDLAEPAGLARVLAPVRPTMKSKYPLAPIESYARWAREDGAPLDPWLRTHWRLGGKIIGTAPHSQTMTGSVADWESWCGMRFPDSDRYVIPRGLSTLSIDVDADMGTYIEPNVWVRHR